MKCHLILYLSLPLITFELCPGFPHFPTLGPPKRFPLFQFICVRIDYSKVVGREEGKENKYSSRKMSTGNCVVSTAPPTPESTNLPQNAVTRRKLLWQRNQTCSLERGAGCWVGGGGAGNSISIFHSECLCSLLLTEVMPAPTIRACFQLFV